MSFQKEEKKIQGLDRKEEVLISPNSSLPEFKLKRRKEIQELKETEESKQALINILEDVEEARRRAEEEKNKTQAIIFNFADGLLFFDNTEILRIFNPQAEIYFEAKSREVLNKKRSALKKFPKLNLLLEFLEKKPGRIFRKELQIEEHLILEISVSPISGHKEKQIGSLLILHDITREKAIERMKTEFVSIAAHQLRTPLSAIKWTLRMVLDGDLGKVSKEQIDFLEKTYQSNERTIRLINDLLNVTRIEEGRYIYKPVFLVQFEKICQEVIDSLEEEKLKREIKFGFLLPPEKLPLIKVDVEKIKLALQNLIGNAFKYTGQGGRVTVSLKKGINEIECEIKDTGVGIPKKEQHRIFSKFFRGSNIIRMETEGTGLGLFIAKNIIEAHGGKIWFESKLSEGTTFYFTLPVGKGIAKNSEKV